jgi:hypothetical protein
MILALLALVGVAATQTSGAAQRSPGDQPAAFNRTIGAWQIAGDVSVGACIMVLERVGPTSLSVASVPGASDLVFSLSNNAWRSLKDDAPGKLVAQLFSRGELSDMWTLSIVSYNSASRGPVINFTIERAVNDGASFIDQFSESDAISFYRDKVPVAHFDLSGSAAGIKELLACRSYLRADPNFDPFAQ